MQRLQSGWVTFKRIFKFIFRKPFLLLPMMFAWGVYVAVAVLVQANYDLEALDTGLLLLVVFGFTFLSTFTIGVSSLFILELIEQHETTGKMNPFKALFDMLTKDLWRALPIILLWALLDFVLKLIIALLNSTRKRKNRPSRPKGPLQRVVEAFRDLVRMGSMTVFTVVAWENLGPKASFDKGFRVFKSQFVEMLTGFVLNRVTGILLALPLILVIVLLQGEATIPEGVWIGLLVYISIIWSLEKLIEQLFVSELYLWYKHYENAVAEAKRLGKTPPASIHDVPKPSFTDNVLDLVKDGPSSSYTTYQSDESKSKDPTNEEDPFAEYDK